MKDLDTLEVMFVDDEQAVLDGIRRALRSVRPRWTAIYHVDPVEAVLAYKERMHSLDAVVCDVNMPQINGLQLLQAVHERTPQTVRIALSGQLDIRTMIGAGKHADTHVCKPVRIDVLCDTIIDHYRRHHAGQPQEPQP